MLLSGDEREGDFQPEDLSSGTDYLNRTVLQKNARRNVRASRRVNPCNSRYRSHEENICPEGYRWVNSEANNMDYLDEPDIDYADDSDQEPIDWSDVEVADDSLVYRSNQSDGNDEEMSDAPDVMDGLSDFSDRDDEEDEDDDDCSPQAIEVDNPHDSVESMSSDEEPDADFDYEDDDTDFDDREDIAQVNQRILNVIDRYSDPIFESSDSDLEDNDSNVSPFSSPSDSSRSRSPVMDQRISGREPPSPVPPAQPTLPVTLEPELPPPSQPSSAIEPQPSNKQPLDKPSSSTLPTQNSDENDGMCCICLDSVSNHVVVPCGHICLCQQCKDLYESNDKHRRKKKCPLCKTPFSIIIKVYK